MSLTDRLDEQHARLVALKATEIELTEGPDPALKALGPLNDPIRMRAALAILLRAERYDAAADLIRDQRADEKWIDLAALVFAFLGDIPRARSLVDLADNSPDLPVMRSSRLAFAEGVHTQWEKRRHGESLLSPYNWLPSDTELAKTVIELLEPLLSLVRANRGIQGDFDLSAVTCATYCAAIADDRAVLEKCGAWLVGHRPLPLIVPELCMRSLTQLNPEALPNRLRVEHPDEFQAAFLAALMERDLFGRFREAFDHFRELAAHDATEEQRRALCLALFETCGQCGSEQIDQTIDIVSKLRPGDSRLLGLLQAIRQLVANDIPGAIDRLEAVRDDNDGAWWQAKAQICERAGDEDGAQIAWEKAGELSPHPDVLQRSIKASIDRRRYQSAVRGLKKLLEQESGNQPHLKMLAWTLVRLNDHAGAAEYLSRLVGIEPSNQEYRIALAQSLARTARITDALCVLEPVCQGEDPPLQAFLLQSELLEADNKPVEAFRLLDTIAADQWDDPRFLLTYMRRGHAAKEDRLAHEAFVRLLELRQEGKVPSELLQEGTLEQLLEHGKHYRARRESLQQGIIAGQLPWLFAEHVLGNAPTWAWMLHTQDLQWLSEEPLNRGAFSVYATNGFTVRGTPSGKRLEELTAPLPGCEIVADLSALLTLHHLGRLSDVAGYFGRIYVPASYGDLRIRDASRFSQHQPSREAELKDIRAAIDHGRRIQVLTVDRHGLKLVDEYSDEVGEDTYRLQDLIPVLQMTQRASPDAIASLREVAHKPSAVDAEHAPLAQGEQVLVELMTLRTLAGQAVFGPVLESFAVSITRTQFNELVAELNAYETAHAAKASHDALWQAVATLAASGKIHWQPVLADPADTDDSDDESPAVYLDALKTAQSLNLPLLADDRVLHVAMYHEGADTASQAFASNCALTAMRNHKMVASSAVAADYRRLIAWRYRFLVPDADVLFVWAEQAMENLPGPALLEASAYLHDCLRDPGLHCGPEATDPPVPMAVKFVTTWLTSIATFLGRVWQDRRFDDEKCTRLTQWVGEEFIPSTPLGLWYHQGGLSMASGQRMGVFTLGMVQATALADQHRANRCLRILAAAVGIESDRYLEAVAAGVQASASKEELLVQNVADERLFTRRMMQAAVLHYLEIGFDPLFVSRFAELGFFRDVSPPPVPPTLADVLGAMGHPDRPALADGPLVFFREGQSVSVIDIDTIILHPDTELRRAGLRFLERACLQTAPWLTPATCDLVRNLSVAIQSGEADTWRPASNQIAVALREDLFAHFAALRQSLAGKYQEGVNQYFGKILHPGLPSLIHLKPPLWSASDQRDEITASIADAALLPTVEEALTSYAARYGYVPLCADLSTPEVVRKWMEQHSGAPVTWERIWGWASASRSVVARYHAVTIALQLPATRPTGSSDSLWSEVGAILGFEDVSGGGNMFSEVWRVHCELAAHYARHIESLHPGQVGERVACYAWWLADMVFQLLGITLERARAFFGAVLTPEAQYSYFRWTAARSPVHPSPLRMATVELNSVWGISLLVQLASCAKSFGEPKVPEPSQVTIGKALHGFLLTSQIADSWEVPYLFAFQDNVKLEDLCECQGYVPEDRRKALGELIAIRRHLCIPEELEATIAQWSELPVHAQYLTMVALKCLVSSANRVDEITARWLEQTAVAVDILVNAADQIIEPFVEMLLEFQQHQVMSWPIRLPHVLVYAIERSEKADRIGHLAAAVLQMSINSGMASPIQRLAKAERWPEWRSAIGTWRQNLIGMGKKSEPWLAARVRATSATVSRLIGPSLAEPEDGETPADHTG